MVQESSQQSSSPAKTKFLGVNSGEAVQSGQCQQYEVLFVGKIKVPQKRAPPMFVDEATEKFHTAEHMQKLCPQSGFPAPGKRIVDHENKAGAISPVSICSGMHTRCRKISEENTNLNQNGILQRRLSDTTLEDVPHPLQISVDQAKDAEDISSQQIEEPNAAHPLSSTLSSSTPSLESNTSPNVPQLSLLSPPAHSLITHTQSLDTAGRNALIKDIQEYSFNPEQFSSIVEDGSLHRQTSLPPLNPKAFMSSALGFRRPSVDSTPSPSERHEYNRTMLFLIGALDFCLISTDNKQTLLNKGFADISHCSQGIKHPEHFGIICRETTLTGMDIYVGYIFQCQSAQVVDEIMKTLKQAFHCALQTSQEKLAASKSFNFCDTCPLFWFHRLCSDTEGLTPEQIQTAIMLRIASLSEREQKDMMNKFQDTVVHHQEEQNVVFIMLLRALCEQKQMKHTHVIQKEIKHDSKKGHSSLNSLRSMAKKTFPSPFESIFRHAASDTNVISEIPKEMTLIKTYSLPPSVGIRFENRTSLKGKENLQALLSPQASTPKDTNSEISNKSSIRATPEKESIDQKKTKASTSVPEASKRAPPTLTTVQRSLPLSHPCNERSLSDTAAVLWELQQDHQQKQSQRSAAFYTTSDAKINELPRAPLKVSMSPLRNIFLKVGSQNRSSSLKEIKEQHAGSQTGSWRKILFNRVQTPLERNIAIPGDGLREQVKHGSNENLKRSSGTLRALWKKAIMEQMILIRMERENKRLQMRQDRTFQKRIKLEYEEISLCPEDAGQKWDAILSTTGPISYDTLEAAVKYGVPRQKRGEIWCSLAEHYSLSNKSLPLDDTPYVELLKKLTPYQHAILIDLGRTYPGHTYYSQALGPGQLSLFSLLKAYSLMDEEVGYCQGLSFLAGVLLLHMAEEKAFQMMKHIMCTLGFRKQYKPDMTALQIQMYQLARLIHDTIPDIHHHFDSLDISPGLYAAPWFLTLFASHFPIGFVSRLLDMVFLRGLDAVFTVAVLLLKTHSSQILNCNSFESVMGFLKTTLPSSGHIGMEKVLEAVLTLDVRQQLQTYQVEYMVLKEEMSQYAAEIEPKLARSLESDNKELQKLNMELSEQLQVAQNTVSTLEASVTSHQSTVRRLEARVRSLQDERDALHHSVNILRRRLENLESVVPVVEKPSEFCPPAIASKKDCSSVAGNTNEVQILTSENIVKITTDQTLSETKENDVTVGSD